MPGTCRHVLDYDTATLCPKLVPFGVPLCLDHEPGGYPTDLLADYYELNGIELVRAAQAEAHADAPPPHVHEPGNPCAPCGERTKMEDLDPDQPLTLIACELPDPCFCLDNRRQCHAAIFGLPCRFPARRDRLNCINHDPDYAEQRRQTRVRATAASAAARSRRPPGLSDLALFLGDRAGIQAAFDFVVRAEILGQISPARSRNIIRALHGAIRNIERRTTRLPAQDMDDYLNYREDIEAFMPDALANARDNDHPPQPQPPPRKSAPAPIPSALPGRPAPSPAFAPPPIDGDWPVPDPGDLLGRAPRMLRAIEGV